MENRGSIGTLCTRGLLFGAVLVFQFGPWYVLAYDDRTTHPALTQEAVRLFNNYYPEKALSSAGLKSLQVGSTEEDADPRYMNHFYDPVSGRGLTGPGVWESSRAWAQDTAGQANYDPGFFTTGTSVVRPYFSSATDFSWDRAVYEYANGDKKKGLQALGHILHLLQDATVPDHTRNDPHDPFVGGGSPYEDYTRPFGPGTFTIDSKLPPVIRPSLADYFYQIASYSNNNFFSKDTFYGAYSQPRIGFREHISGIGNIGYSRESTRDVPLAKISETYDSEGQRYVVSYELASPSDLILSSYWKHLSLEAVREGAGLIKLFFDEVEKEKQSGRLLAMNRSTIQKAADFAIETGKTVASATVSLAKETGSAIAATLGSAQKTLADISKSMLSGFSFVTVDPTGTVPAETKEAKTQSEVNAIISEKKPDEQVLVVQTENESQKKALLAKIAELEAGAKTIHGLIEKLRAKEEEAKAIEPPVEKDPKDIAPTSTPMYVVTEVIILADGSTTTVTCISYELNRPCMVPGFGGGGGGPVAPPEENDPPPEDPAPAPLVTPVLSSSACDESIATDVCLLTASSLEIKWTSAGDGATYDILVGSVVVGNVTGLTYTLEGVSQEEKVVSVMAKRGDDNVPSSSLRLSYYVTPLALSEINWVGNLELPRDEWIELKNRTPYTLKMSKFSVIITDSGVAKSTIGLSGELAPGAYYLSERTDEGTVGGVTAGMIYGDDAATYDIPDATGGIELYMGSALLERAPAYNDPFCGVGEGWCSASVEMANSIERNDYAISSTDKSNWHGNDGSVANGTDANGEPIYGTPGQPNSPKPTPPPAMM